jgi:hypothetical protein
VEQYHGALNRARIADNYNPQADLVGIESGGGQLNRQIDPIPRPRILK